MLFGPRNLKSSLDGCAPKRASVVFTISVLVAPLTGCGSLGINHSASLGEAASGYTYIPIDPTKVEIILKECAVSYSDFGDDPQKKAPKLKLLDTLPDNAVRMSMETSDFKGNVTYGVSKAGTSGSSYRLTADYVNSDTVNKSVWIRKTIIVRSTKLDGKDGLQEQTAREPIAFSENAIYESFYQGNKAGERKSIPGTEQFEVKSFATNEMPDRKDLANNGYQEFSVPVYVGIGLRIVAEGRSLSDDATISGIGIVGAEAEAKRLVGSLTVQTLGVNGQAVASALPVQSELSRTTAENAFVAIGSIKSMLHQPDTIKLPRVVGLYLPFAGGKPLVNALISDLSRNPVPWCPNGYTAKEAAAAAAAKEAAATAAAKAAADNAKELVDRTPPLGQGAIAVRQ